MICGSYACRPLKPAKKGKFTALFQRVVGVGSLGWEGWRPLSGSPEVTWMSSLLALT